MIRPDRPVLGLTLGDVAGIGPEVTAKALARREVRQWCRPVVLGDLGALKSAASALGLNLVLETFRPGTGPNPDSAAEIIPLTDLPAEDLIPGRPTPAGAAAAARFIETGAALALAGKLDGLVTAPISKEALRRAGYNFPGHTEFLAHLSGNPPVVMMLAGDRLKVVLVTIHEPLAAVPGLLTIDRIVETARITQESLRRDFGLDRPRLAAAALNPHAGEGGLFGLEEERIIAPAVARARALGLDLTGPFSADTLYYRASAGEFDAVVSMYHDQGLIPFKLLHFKDGVNVTLGLPFIRASVDHGTAYHLAGQGRADPDSLLAAIRLAAAMAGRRKKQPSRER
ncbi:MAG: 4-hydroxythreonine-4-phosphate dehydrogenase PdxA [Thermodesulfobacteriota bacterium]